MTHSTALAQRFRRTPACGQMAVLVVAYEPTASTDHLLAALRRLDRPASVEVAISAGLLVASESVLRLAHSSLTEIAMRSCTEEERCAAHLALAHFGAARRAMFAGAESLTDKESQVAGLASSGMRTKEIAQTLYVSPKTVEYHLSNLYRKVGARSRTELGHLLREGGGVPREVHADRSA